VLVQYPVREVFKGGIKEIVENRFPLNELRVDNEGSRVQRVPVI